MQRDVLESLKPLQAMEIPGHAPADNMTTGKLAVIPLGDRALDCCLT
jgi:hypothetical protein